MNIDYCDMPDRASDRARASAWAREVLAGPTVVLDTETTGLGSTAEVVQLAVVDLTGRPLLDTLVRPVRPIPAGASRIHGITDDMVAAAPLFGQVAPLLADAVRGKRVIIYNAAYDIGIVDYCWNQYKRLGPVPAEILGADCAMLQYAAYAGDWNSYHGDYRWQTLPGACHGAVGDCIATIALLKRMAAGQ